MTIEEISAGEERALREPLERAGLPARVVDGCVTHFRLLRRWNRTHNLTRITSAAEAAVLHYLDCIVPVFGSGDGSVPTVPTDAADPRTGLPTEFVDVGSGAGFPGLLVALLEPTRTATLVEPARKRASFLQLAATALALPRVQVVAPEDVPSLDRSMFPWVLSRATFSAGARGELWRYVSVGGCLWVWTTPQERSAWEAEVATWSDAELTWRSYMLPDGTARLLAVIRRAG
jgi:16S rRNA (guanine527-N7)-methyltransferase